MLRELCHHIGLLNNYCAELQGYAEQLKEATVESALGYLAFVSYTIKFLRCDIVYMTLGELNSTCRIAGTDIKFVKGHTHEHEWKPLELRFSDAKRVLKASISRIETLARLAERSDRMDESFRRTSDTVTLSKQTSQPEEYAKLPCVVLPKVRTKHVFDRSDFIKIMENFFDEEDPKRGFRSLAIYGLGGVGKTSVALKYAESRWQQGKLDALLWVHSEKLVSIRHSFTEIALRLKLPDARAGDDEENHALVLSWLQYTRKSSI